ncbi:hypothetical protein JTE90_016089 [Oedothorax gibbosus]|uniref:Uncharacterized protein n=1 Tax=Oedothorax gibbosus TaxID=931172 RepID=A0AAV6TS55_9ARAC|nr:hypothetical protein JTE90_016089 [Oedothorax gibbosus]
MASSSMTPKNGNAKRFKPTPAKTLHEDLDFDFDCSGPLFKVPETPLKKLKPAYDLDLAQDEPQKRRISPYAINIGLGLALEVKLFKGASYVCLSKSRGDSAHVKRVTFHINQLALFHKAVGALFAHCKKEQ